MAPSSDSFLRASILWILCAWFGASPILEAGAIASDQVGTLTQVRGEVRLFTDPSKSLPRNPPRALFEGEYYTVRDARIGDRIQWGNVLRTSPGAQAKVVFENGDQFTLGPGSSYRVFWDKDASDGKPRVELSYGQFRGVVAKGGPRSRFNIRTKSATMGVRGTDFFVESEPGSGETQLSVLRGSVEMRPRAADAQTLEKAAIEVKTGFSGEVTSRKSVNTDTKTGTKTDGLRLDVRRTTQEDLVVIQKSTSVARVAIRDSVASPEPETLRQVEALEKKAVESTLKDIQAADPKLYAQITENAKASPISSSDVLNTATLQSIAREAPKAPPVRRKPQRKELEEVAPADYDKYFEMLNR